MTGYGTSDWLREQKIEEEKRRKREEMQNARPVCKGCGKPKQYDRGDGCVHEPHWYCAEEDCPGEE